MVTANVPSNRRGFTLIELLVVISIISLLISILLPALGSARRSAQEISDASQLRQLGVAVTAWSTDNDGAFPSTNFPNTGGAAGPNTVTVHEKLSGYDGTSTRSPTGAAGQWGGFVWLDNGMHNIPNVAIWQSPLDTLPRNFGNAGIVGTSYSMNTGPSKQTRASNGSLDVAASPNASFARGHVGVSIANRVNRSGGMGGPDSADSVKQSEVVSASNTVMMMTYGHASAWYDHPGGWQEMGSIQYAFSLGFGTADGVSYPVWPNGPSRFYAHERKVGDNPTPNMVFVDGHTQKVDVVEVVEETGQSVGGTLDLVGTMFDALN